MNHSYKLVAISATKAIHENYIPTVFINKSTFSCIVSTRN